MTGKDLYRVITNIDDDIIKEADVSTKKAKFSWKIPAAAACFVILVCITFIGFKILSNNAPAVTHQDLAVYNDYVDIYYVDNNTLQKQSVKLNYTPKEIFAEWKNLNHMPNDVDLIDFKIDSNGHESSENESTAAYTVGDTFVLNITLSKESVPYLAGSNHSLLLKSLEKTMSYNVKGGIEYKTIHIYANGQSLIQ